VFIYIGMSLLSEYGQVLETVGQKANGQGEGFADKRKAMEEAVNGIVAAGDAPSETPQDLRSCAADQNLSYCRGCGFKQRI